MKNSELKDEMSKLQIELSAALENVLKEVGDKLKKHEADEIKKEVDELNELLERLKTGTVWVSLFGRASVGKSSIVNSIVNDDLAVVGIEHDLTKEATAYLKEPWHIVDVPGIMGEKVNEKIAIEEAKKAHGHIFVIEGEPFGPEIELFDLVAKSTPEIPKVVFVNKSDMLLNIPKKDRDTVRHRIYEKMREYVKSDEDIVYGSAQLYDPNQDEMVRQKLVDLEERLYADTSTFGQVINVWDPAQKAETISNEIKSKIINIRKKIARKVINGYGIAAIASSFVPFDSFLVAPGMYASLVYVLAKLMGEKESPNFNKRDTAVEILKVCGLNLAAEFVAVTTVETFFSIFGPIGSALDFAFLSYFKYRRTVIFGEAMLLYIENGFSFGNNQKEIILKAKEEAHKHYSKLKSK